MTRSETESRHTRVTRDTRTTAWIFVAVAGSLLAAAAVAWLGGGSGWLGFLSAFVSGFAAASLGFFFWVLVPLSEMAAASRSFSSGDLSLSVPERGPLSLRRVASVINNMAADFQEVLLLFSHLIQSALRSAKLLQSHVVEASGSEDDRRIAAEIIRDVYDMQEMVKDFTYFRVKFEGDGIVDTSIERPREAGSEDSASRARARVSLSTSTERG